MSEKEVATVYGVKFEVCDDDRPITGLWTESVLKRIVKNELDLEPSTENDDGDIRFQTTDPEKALKLLEMVFLNSEGGWWTVGTGDVMHIARMTGTKSKFSNTLVSRVAQNESLIRQLLLNLRTGKPLDEGLKEPD